jgi:hypothetical protein
VQARAALTTILFYSSSGGVLGLVGIFLDVALYL